MSKDKAEIPGSSKGPMDGSGTGSSYNDNGAQNGAGPDKPGDAAAEALMVKANKEFMQDSNKTQGYDVTKDTV